MMGSLEELRYYCWRVLAEIWEDVRAMMDGMLTVNDEGGAGVAGVRADRDGVAGDMQKLGRNLDARGFAGMRTVGLISGFYGMIL